jgi:hypothetical protein
VTSRQRHLQLKLAFFAFSEPHFHAPEQQNMWLRKSGERQLELMWRCLMEDRGSSPWGGGRMAMGMWTDFDEIGRPVADPKRFSATGYGPWYEEFPFAACGLNKPALMFDAITFCRREM